MLRRARWILHCTVLVACFFAVTALTHAQSAANSGQIVGQVLDQSGAAIAGIEVTVRNSDTNFSRSATTDSAGRYAASNLPLGPYEVSVKAAGFETASQEAFVTLGSSVSSNFKVSVAAVTGSVEVIAGSPGIEPTRAAAKSILTDLQIHNLPSNGRRLQNFVIDTPAALIEPECRGFSISGQKGIYSNVSIDGGDYDSAWGCGIRSRSESAPSFGIEALQEVQVVRNTFNAEFGRSTGGVIQMSTKSGTNQYNGSGYEHFRNGGLASARRLRSPVDRHGEPVRRLVRRAPRERPHVLFHGAGVSGREQAGPGDLLRARRTEPSQYAGRAGAGRGRAGRAVRCDQQLAVVHHSHRSPDRGWRHAPSGGSISPERSRPTRPAPRNLSTGLGIASTTTSAASNQVTQPDTNYTALGQWTSALSNRHLNELRFQFAVRSGPVFIWERARR